MGNVLLHTRFDHGPLNKNEAHQFAARRALCHYASGAIYTFIPKNACSTMRYTLALANRCIRGKEDFDWIHKNNQTFAATMSELATASSSFVLLRCPYRRLASCYLDRIVNNQIPEAQLAQALGGVKDAGQVTFRQFARAMVNPLARKVNNHWRDQGDFLIYETYTAYLRLEAFSEAVSEIKRLTGLDVVDARELTTHGLHRLTSVDDRKFCDMPASEISTMMANGRAPTHAAMYDESVAADVADAFATDIGLYRRLFGATDLMYV